MSARKRDQNPSKSKGHHYTKAEKKKFAQLAKRLGVYPAAVGAPRVAAIEHPFGHTLGQPGDREGQMAVLRATLDALKVMDVPGSVIHLLFERPEPPAKARVHPPQPPPITKYLRRHPWLFLNLLSRNIPQS